MIILAVDHGTKNIGIAICDELGIAARPLAILPHRSKDADAGEISRMADENNAGMILVGVSFTEEGEPNPAGRRALNFISVLRTVSLLPVLEWDESLTTQDARSNKLILGYSKKKRQGHHDSSAAAVLLQDYIDAQVKRVYDP